MLAGATTDEHQGLVYIIDREVRDDELFGEIGRAVWTTTDSSTPPGIVSLGGNNPGNPGDGEWLISGTDSDYDIYFTKISGDDLSITSNSTDLWLSLGSTRAWEMKRTAVGTSTGVYKATIRLNSSGEVLDEAFITFTVVIT
jgi:hypothetical protein